ncbi:MAG: phosphoribosylanthranilate isomerase [Candidatus Gastranaerophilales bacterium]|nr:phosphoribosylanthranilate isomerase [Candidatus Gastranaerophilales bacterium]
MNIKVKICGITNLKDALAVQEFKASAIGFIFYPESKRYIEPKKAREIIKELKIKTVGVFVNENPNKINDIIDETGLDYVQLHGIEPLKDCIKLKKPYIKIVRNKEDLKTYENAQFFLVDSQNTKEWGGTGKLADWDFACEIKNKPLILSGGLNKDNVISAINYVKPYAIDVSSSVEKTQGIKDYELLKQFFDKIKTGREK